MACPSLQTSEHNILRPRDGYHHHHLRHMHSHMRWIIITRTSILLEVRSTVWLDSLPSVMAEDMEEAQKRTTIDVMINNIL